MPELKIDIGNLKVVSMEVGGVLLRIDGQGMNARPCIYR